MKTFLKRLNYTFGNEDWESEQKALQITPENRIVCITASGDRPLNLLVNPCKEVIAVDMNPLQNHLLHLKSSAMRSLDFETYLSFLGATTAKNRFESLNLVLNELTSESFEFWEKNKKWIGKGILYQGRLESVTRFFAFFLNTKKNKQLFQFNNLEEQKEFVIKTWDSPVLRKAFEWILSLRISRYMINDPSLYAHLAPGTNLGIYFYERILNLLKVRLAKESILLSLLFQGYVEPEGFPPYLNKNGFDAIRKRLPSLHVYTEDVIHYLKRQPSNSIDRFSLSDIASYMPQETFHALIEEVFRTAAPSARFCIRQISTHHQLPIHLKENFLRESHLEKELEIQDHCFVYRFMAGAIRK